VLPPGHHRFPAGTKLSTVTLTVVLCAAAPLAATIARADDATELAGLLSEPVVSGASKSAELASDAPATTSVLTGADMRRYGIRSLAEAIDFLGMGLITQDPLHSVEVGGRGVLLTGDFGNHFLVVVDGHALNEPWGGASYYEQGLGLPLELIDHIELILGPGSVLYGGSAMFGVINIITKKASAYRGLTLVAEGGASPQHGLGGTFTSFAPGDLGNTYRLGAGIGKSFHLFGQDASFVGHAEVYSQNGPSFDFPVQGGNVNAAGEPTNYGPRAPGPGVWGGRVYNQYNTFVPTAWGKLTLGDLSILARASRYRRATPYINLFNQLASDFDEPRSYEQEQFFSLDVRYQKHIGERLALVARGYADDYRYEGHSYNSDTAACAATAPDPCDIVPHPHARWAGTELQTSVDWWKNDALTTLLGADVRVRNIEARVDVNRASDGQTAASSPAITDTEVPWSVYAQQRYSPVRRLHLNAGARLDADPRGGKRISPRAAFAAEPWKNGVIKGIYAEALRAPSYFESVFRPGADLSQQLGQVVDLRHETVRGIEVSIEQKLGTQRLLLGVYRTWWDDMISLTVVDPTTFALEYRNASSISNYGFNTRFEGSAGQWAYGASLTGGYARRNSAEGSTKLPVAPSLFGNARASYDLPGAWPTLALATSFVGSRLADRAIDGNFPVTPTAPFTLTLRGTMSGDVPGIPGLGYRLSLNYVTAAHSPYVSGPIQIEDPTVADRPAATLAPVNRLSGFLTLTYTLPL
jgi:outer membrane receptor for ferrienterochelin and colicins